MKTIAKLSAVALFAIGSSAAFGQAATTETTATGPATDYSGLISTIETGSPADMTTFSEASTVNCVKVSTLQETAEDNAAALDDAVTAAQEKLATFRTEISGSTALWDKIKTSCGMPDLDVNKVIALQSDEGGQFTVYVDDRA